MTEQSMEKIAGEKEPVLVVTDGDNYVEKTVSTVKDLTELGMTGVYATTGRPCMTINEKLEEKDIDTGEIFFIDLATEEPDNSKENAVFLESPENLTDLSIAMNHAVNSIEKEDKYLILDSITALQIYNKDKAILKFAQFLAGKIREWEVAGFVFLVKSDADKELISHLKSFMDQTIED